MAILHDHFDDQTEYGRMLRRWLDTVKLMLNLGQELYETMQYMKDEGVITQNITDRFGFDDIATAQAGIAEFESAFGKISTDNQVTVVNTALRNVCGKLR